MASPRAPSAQLLRVLQQLTATPRRPTNFKHQHQPVLQHKQHKQHSKKLFTTISRHERPVQPHQERRAQSSTPETATTRRNPYAPTSRDRGPVSKEDTQTDFSVMDIYSNTPEPATSIDACTPGGFHLNNGTKITGGSGVLLAGGEAWSWKPWVANTDPGNSGGSETQSSAPKISNLLDKRGVLVIPPSSFSVFRYLHPKPDLLLIGTGSRTLMLHPESRKYIIDELGMRVDVMDTANASAAYNLLAKERGVEGGAGIGGAMLPVGWKGVEVKKR